LSFWNVEPQGLHLGQAGSEHEGLNAASTMAACVTDAKRAACQPPARSIAALASGS
jgi:hypothetical protein